MKGLILKDLYSMKIYLKSYASMLLFFLIFAVAMKSPSYMVFMGTVMGVSTLFAVLSVEEASGFAFSMTLPVTRKQIVQEKYLFFVGVMCLIWGITTALGLMIYVFVKGDIIECFVSALVCAAFYLFIMALILPVTLKWNVQKARYVMLAAVALPCVTVIAWARMQETNQNLFMVEAMWDQHVGMIIVGIILAAIVVYVLSYQISLQIFAKKEF